MTDGSIQKNESELDRSLSLFSSSECIAWLTVYVTESVAIVTLNFLTIIVFVRNRSLRKRSMYLVINLAVADMLVGGFTEVMALVNFGNWPCHVWRVNVKDSEIWAAILLSMRELFVYASLTNLAAISLERLHATFRPFKHRVIKEWVLSVVIAATWVTAGLFVTVLGLVWGYDFNYLVVMFHVLCSFMSICLFIIVVSYSSILVKVYWGAHPQHHGAANRERKLTKTLFIVTLVSLITWLPFVVLTAKFWLLTEVFLHFHNSTMVLLFANSLVNPIVYTIRMPEFRRALASLFRRQHIQIQVQIPRRTIP